MGHIGTRTPSSSDSRRIQLPLPAVSIEVVRLAAGRRHLEHDHASAVADLLDLVCLPAPGCAPRGSSSFRHRRRRRRLGQRLEPGRALLRVARARTRQARPASRAPHDASILLEVEQHLALLRATARSRASRRRRRSRRPPPPARRSPASDRGRVGRSCLRATSVLAHPVEQAAPERLVHQDDRHLRASCRSARASAPRTARRACRSRRASRRRRSRTHEHHLAREEIAEAQADVLVAVAPAARAAAGC